MQINQSLCLSFPGGEDISGHWFTHIKKWKKKKEKVGSDETVVISTPNGNNANKIAKMT